MNKLAFLVACAIAVVAPLSAKSTLDVHVVPPAAALVGGERATIAWEGDAGADVCEWEAFLSVDGGRYYAFRITPHLTADRHSFEFTVPDVGSDRARFLLRFGDEKRETEVEFAPTFRIRAPGVLTRLGRAGSTSTGVARAGEPARPDGAGVAEWIEGDRHGRHLRRFALASTDTVHGSVDCLLVDPEDESQVEPPPPTEFTVDEPPFDTVYRRPIRNAGRTIARRSASPLALTTRLNI